MWIARKVDFEPTWYLASDVAAALIIQGSGHVNSPHGFEPGVVELMNILGYIHTFNDEEVIDRAVQTLVRQSYSVNGILVVDNGSTDGTIGRLSPEQVSVIRHPENLGTSGSVKTGLQYALAKGYDWIWILDADSLPRSDALEQLVNLHESFDSAGKRHIGVLSCSQILAPSPMLFQGRRLTPMGMRPPKIDPSQPYCECDSTIWSGSLINLQAVRAVGLPRCGTLGYWEDLSLDYGDVEFIYRIKQAGYRVLVHRFSIIDHPVGKAKQLAIFGRHLVSTNHSADRRYLFSRNMVYFWLYIHRERQLVLVSIYLLGRLLANMLKILAMEENRLRKIWACLRGAWDGFRKQLHRQS